MRRRVRVYGAVLAMVPKFYLAYRAWVWAEFIVQIIAMTILVFFWRAIYENGGPPGGPPLPVMLNYILIAQMLMPLVENRLIFSFGWMVRDGQVAIDLLRPLDFQGRFYADALGNLGLSLLLKGPLLIIAMVFFGLQLPADAGVWAVFSVALLLGHAVLFFFDWIFACLAFYSTETWGLSVVRVAIATVFSGMLFPLEIMPDWLRAIAQVLPFAQSVAAPVSLLSGITPVSQAAGVWAVQLLWLIGLAVVSRGVFNLSLRKVTVQGG